MTVAEFKRDLEAFVIALQAHHRSWSVSVDPMRPNRQMRNPERLAQEASQLSRELGRLRHHIHRFMPDWIMGQAASGAKWDALSEAVSAASVGIVKGSSLTAVIDRLHQLLGILDGRDPAEELDREQRLVSTAGTPPVSQPKERPDDKVAVADTVPTPPANAEPMTLDRLSIGDMLSAMRRLSIGSILTLMGIAVAVIGALYGLAGLVHRERIEALSGQRETQQQLLDSLMARNTALRDSLLTNSQTRRSK